MRHLAAALAACAWLAALPARAAVRVVSGDSGVHLEVEGRPFLVRGMNWDHVPVGENYAYSLWGRPDDEVRRVLDRDMALLRDMHVNAIRVYVGMPARWIRYVYERYGIYTVINHPLGRYGLTVDGAWRGVTDYSDPAVRRTLRAEVVELVEAYRDTPGLLMWLLGNENNYGLFWENAAIADLPLDRQQDARAEALYSLVGEVISDIKARDLEHPVALANGDLQFVDLIARHCASLDVMGANVYRGRSAGDLFAVVKQKLGVPFVFTEFGADAWDARAGREDGETQALFLREQWREIDLNAEGNGGVGNAVGGFVFQWADGWWKHLQEARLDEHDTTASWANGGYPDHVPGENNMNEEWWGIMARATGAGGDLPPLYPRAAYFLLRDGFARDPYAEGGDAEAVDRHWRRLDPAHFQRVAAAERLARGGGAGDERLRLFDLTLELSTFTTGGRGLADAARNAVRLGHTESLYVGVEARPTGNLVARATVNVLGNVANNPIDEIFFERRGGGTVKLYQGSLEWNEALFDLSAFYRQGHYHWGYEGDMFGLYPEANYQPAVDAFNVDAPSGALFSGKKALEGLKVVFGPEVYWGANPTIIGKYARALGPLDVAVMHQQDVAQRSDAGTSSFIPMPRTTRSTVTLGLKRGGLKLEWGAIAAGTDRVGRAFQAVVPHGGPTYLGSGYWVLDDTVRWYDTLGTKARATWTGGSVAAYAQAGYRGLVADSNPDPVLNLTGFRLRESGQGNHFHLLAGGTWSVTQFLQVAPNVLYQKPLVGPLPTVADRVDSATGTYFPGLAPRNQLDDPFWVRSNRETLGAELLLVFDPTPETWFWAWNSAAKENAPFAASLDLTYRHLPTAQDAGLGVLASGQVFAFPGSAPAQDLWEAWARFVINRGALRVVGAAWAGTGQANGSDPRLVHRSGVEARLDFTRLSFHGSARFNDWGPYDYHRDYNLTFPLQLMGDLGFSADTPQWFYGRQAKFGLAGKYRTLDAHSPRVALPATGPVRGEEWEVRTYVRFGL